MNLKIIPNEGIGPVTIGMTRGQVIEALSQKPDSDEDTDYFYESGLRVDYSEEGLVEFIEVSRDCNLMVFFDDQEVFSTKVEDLVAYVRETYSLDEEDPEAGYSYIFPEIELSFWRSELPEATEMDHQSYFDTVGLGKQGYFSD